MRLGVVIPYFDAKNDAHRRKLLAKCVAGIHRERWNDWLIVECVFDKGPSRLAGYDNHHVTLPGDMLWQKERLVWLGCERLFNEGCDAVAQLDADTVFDEPGWPLRITKALEQRAAVQNCAVYHQKFNDIDRSGPSAMAHYLDTGEMVSKRCGGSWSFRKDLLDRTGLYQHCIIGGGDNPWSFAAADPKLLDRSTLIKHYSKTTGERLRQWTHLFHDTAQQLGGIGVVRQSATTLAHGTLTGRLYSKRHKGMVDFEHEDVHAEPGMPFRWCTNKPALHARVRTYLTTRDA